MVVEVKLPFIGDTSHWKVIPDFALVDPKPLLILTKATEGTSYVDPTFVPYFRDLLQDGIHRGCFHFFRKAANALEQAKHFCNTVRPHITDKDILVLDVEEGGETAGMLWTWLDYVRKQFPNNLILIYSRKNILEAIPTFIRSALNVRALAEKAAPYLPIVALKALDYIFAKVQNRNHVLNAIQMTMAERAFFKEFPTWPAGYPLNPNIYATIPSFYIPDQARWGEPWLWQYTASAFVTGISNEVDCNLGLPKLLARLGSEPIPQPPPDNGEPMPNPNDFDYSITPGNSIGSKVRANHDTRAAQVGSLQFGKDAFGNEKWIAPADLAGVCKKDDVWLKVKLVDGEDMEGWIAEIHMGVRYATITQLDIPNPTPQPEEPITVDFILHDVRVPGDRYAARRIQVQKEA